MNEKTNIASKIAVHEVEQGNPMSGCHSSGVQLLFKESMSVTGNPNSGHLRKLLESKGYQVVKGAKVTGTLPFLRLYVFNKAVDVHPDEILALLRRDPEIDLAGYDAWKGNRK